ncbi:ATP-binding protein [Neptuniibacter sp. 2_MG-2023]|uniref:ATP-binding protein n=1 Tax=Neptuniibacter sp. 2_MG-2023 TaxID=3062671 RepID=UPI0026E37894|nr:ATP-binding protein [Neptuniibacter sp. 2_MG-2023]MDO6512948.1 ATP-binding protein [Neptuniibacter sp. 2_MG-2023]
MHFRTRIFVISILTVSAVLAIVITLSWSRIMQVELDHLDDRLCMEARRTIPRFDENGSLRNLAVPRGAQLTMGPLLADLADKLRIDSPQHLMLLIESSEHDLLIKAAEINLKTLIGTMDWVDAGPLVGRCQVASFEYEEQQWRAALFSVEGRRSFIAVEVAATSNDLKSTLRETLIVVVPISLLLSILGSWLIASHTIRPINHLHRAMDLVTQKDLSHRLSGHKEDKEFQMLIEAYNTMLDRLEDSFQQISRFTADAAHELKTPLTVLRGKLEQAVLSEDSSQLDLNAILDEVGQLSTITRKLLLLSQADAGSMALHLEPVNITELLDELIADMELLSEEQILDCSIERALVTRGDLVLLRQLLNNLLANVIRYSLLEKGVIIQARQDETGIDILISNYCRPISSEVRSQLFDRFYRGEPEHTQGISGSGLGLSLSREIARAHGGDLTLEPSSQDVVLMRLLIPILK